MFFLAISRVGKSFKKRLTVKKKGLFSSSFEERKTRFEGQKQVLSRQN
jgi:hypothetical protein